MQQLIDQLKERADRLRNEFGLNVTLQCEARASQYGNGAFNSSHVYACMVGDDFIESVMEQDIDTAINKLREKMSRRTPEALAAQLDQQAAELTAKAKAIRDAVKPE
jgi:hypothetical protein